MDTLQDLYTKNLNNLIQVRECFLEEDLEGPLLMNLDTYFNQSKKLMVIGQETNGWGCDYKDVAVQLKLYKEFNVGSSYKASPFWNIIRKVEDVLSIDKYSCAWSNINRYEHRGKEPKAEILEKIESLDYLLKDEIRLIKPDVCIFFTNHKYDYRIRKLFSDVIFTDVPNLPQKHFAFLNHSELPKITIRAPHPKTIRLQEWENVFLEEVKNCLWANVSLHWILRRQIIIETLRAQ